MNHESITVSRFLLLNWVQVEMMKEKKQHDLYFVHRHFESCLMTRVHVVNFTSHSSCVMFQVYMCAYELQAVDVSYLFLLSMNLVKSLISER